MFETVEREIAQSAAAWVLEHGLDYGQAKRKARSALGLPDRSPLPSNPELEDALREHIALYLGDTQPQELLAMRKLALQWMEKLTQFRPHLSGAVWKGLATRHQGISIQLFADDPKMVDIWLLNAHERFELHEHVGAAGKPVPALALEPWCEALQEHLLLVLAVHGHEDLRKAKRMDERQQPLRGNTAAVGDLINGAKKGLSTDETMGTHP